MISSLFIYVAITAFVGCVLTTPFVTRIASWTGAIDRPDQFRRVHKGAIPRMGGLGMAVGVGVAVLWALRSEELHRWPDFVVWSKQLAPVLFAALVILVIGVIDDSRGMGPRAKLLGQAVAVLILYAGGIRIDKFALLGLQADFTSFNAVIPIGDFTLTVGLPGLCITMLWFLGCMNIWNLIDGMDGLASGVGLLVSVTLMLVAIHLDNTGAAVLAAALAGSLIGFLLYNWYPACIFLGDTGSLLIGLLIGVLGVQGSLKGSAAVSILFPILAMGLPISDTAMAIFRRWVRNLPLSLADRRHVHHLLIGLGLNPRQASFLLYIFSGFLCGVVLLGVALNNEFLALVLAVSGCVAFLLILTSRRDELDHLRADFSARMTRGRQERSAARIAWETVQRLELSPDQNRVWELLVESAQKFGCERLALVCQHREQIVFEADTNGKTSQVGEHLEPMTGPTTAFRVPLSPSFAVMVQMHQRKASNLAPDIAFRFLQQLAEAGGKRFAELRGIDFGLETRSDQDQGSDSPAETDPTKDQAKAPLTASVPTSWLWGWASRIGRLGLSAKVKFPASIATTARAGDGVSAS